MYIWHRFFWPSLYRVAELRTAVLILWMCW